MARRAREALSSPEASSIHALDRQLRSTVRVRSVFALPNVTAEGAHDDVLRSGHGRLGDRLDDPGNVVFWGLLILGAVAVIRYTGLGQARSSSTTESRHAQSLSPRLSRSWRSGSPAARSTRMNTNGGCISSPRPLTNRHSDSPDSGVEWRLFVPAVGQCGTRR